MTDLYPIQTGTPKPIVKSFMADLPAAFVNSVTLSMTVVVGFSYQNAIKALFEEGGPFFIKSSRVYPWIMPWIVAIIMTILAVVVGRVAGYKTAPIATALPLKQTPPPAAEPTKSPIPF
jgi:hypothetical protein